MNKQKLVMKYHPAKKEVEFHRYHNEKEIPIRNDSRLRHYMNMKGKFVLQDFGNSFFDDIAKAFDGLKIVDIEVITTKLDYEDFMQMVEYYNEGSICKMNPTLLAELPDMKQTYLEVVKHGEESISMLSTHRQKLFEIPLKNENVKKSAERFAKQIDVEIKNIREKIDSLGDNNVSLCFTGVYSSGKSALINALIGYRVLPEDIKSETAKMFQVSSPKDKENVKIEFEILDVDTEIEWNEKKECFEFHKGPSENPIREEIQLIMNSVKEKKLRQYEQIREILNTLNSCQEVSSSIRVKFPVALDSKNVQFTIYDTPGTDSNYIEHQNILTEALEEQRQSILIFVAKPDGLEGEGNNALLNYLKAAEGKSKTSIDIGRSLFVINKADSQSADNRMTLQHEEIKTKDGDSFTIKLSDKKLFFTSARYAYAAKAVANGIATSEDIGFFEAGKVILAKDEIPTSYCYRQNRCATSEIATKRMLEKCEIALKKSRDDGDEAKMLDVCSGVYALENEIRVYGEKYASAVKAFAIIDSVDKALSQLSGRARSLRDSNQEGITAIENNIKELEKTITAAIEEEYHNAVLLPKVALPDDMRKKLKLDSDSIQETLIGNTKNYLEAEIKGWFFGRGKVKFRESDKDKIKKKIAAVIDDYTKEFLKQRELILKDRRDTFMNAVKNAIAQNGSISESAKEVFLNIPEPEISKPDKSTDIGNIYDANKRVNRFLWKASIELNKENFIKDVEEKLSETAGKMRAEYEEDYRKALEILLNQIKYIFESNLETYSLNMQAMVEDRETMIRLGEKIEGAAVALAKSQETLNKTIWKEV